MESLRRFLSGQGACTSTCLTGKYFFLSSPPHDSIETYNDLYQIRIPNPKKNKTNVNSFSAIMVLDVLIRHLPSMTYATVGRSFFTPQDAKPLANGAEVWQGFYQSARPAVGKYWHF